MQWARIQFLQGVEAELMRVGSGDMVVRLERLVCTDPQSRVPNTSMDLSPAPKLYGIPLGTRVDAHLRDARRASGANLPCQ